MTPEQLWDFFMSDGTVYANCLVYPRNTMEWEDLVEVRHPRFGCMLLNVRYIVKIMPAAAFAVMSTNGPDETGVLGKIGGP